MHVVLGWLSCTVIYVLSVVSLRVAGGGAEAEPAAAVGGHAGAAGGDEPHGRPADAQHAHPGPGRGAPLGSPLPCDAAHHTAAVWWLIEHLQKSRKFMVRVAERNEPGCALLWFMRSRVAACESSMAVAWCLWRERLLTCAGGPAAGGAVPGGHEPAGAALRAARAGRTPDPARLRHPHAQGALALRCCCLAVVQSACCAGMAPRQERALSALTAEVQGYCAPGFVCNDILHVMGKLVAVTLQAVSVRCICIHVVWNQCRWWRRRLPGAPTRSW